MERTTSLHAMHLQPSPTWYLYVEGNPVSLVHPSGLQSHVNFLDWAHHNGVAARLYDWADNYRPSEYNVAIVHGTDVPGVFSTGTRNLSASPLRSKRPANPS